MKTSQQWFEYFKGNLKKERVDWQQKPKLTDKELNTILKSMQAWQLGETSDGSNLLKASASYAQKIDDDSYVKAVTLFIKEEQKHGNNLGKYLDSIGQPRIQRDLGDSLFRKIRYFNANMELWTLAVISVESTAQIFYQSLRQATGCNLLRQICTDILIDEAAHIQFQAERLAIIYHSKNWVWKSLTFYAYKYFYFSTAFVVWFAHRRVFKAGGNNLASYHRKMTFKFNKIAQHLNRKNYETHALQAVW
ncbi:MAG: ferritin-like domain-containing protein [Bacteroidota bacterium]